MDGETNIKFRDGYLMDLIFAVWQCSLKSYFQVTLIHSWARSVFLKFSNKYK